MKLHSRRRIKTIRIKPKNDETKNKEIFSLFSCFLSTALELQIEHLTYANEHGVVQFSLSPALLFLHTLTSILNKSQSFLVSS